MAEFLQAHIQVEENEGGYSADPKDRGGVTYAGISRKFFPNWKGWAIVDAHMPLKRGDIIQDAELIGIVKQFYKSNFWDKCYGDSIDSQAVATFVYDWFVNSGKPAIKALQRCVGTKQDGAMGTQTVNAVNGYHEQDLLEALKKERIAFYKAIVAKDATQGKFLNGWLARVERLT